MTRRVDAVCRACAVAIALAGCAGSARTGTANSAHTGTANSAHSGSANSAHSGSANSANSAHAGTSGSAAPRTPVANAAPTLRSIPVVRCQTTFGVPPVKVLVPSRLSALAPSRSTGQLVAYTNTEVFLVGPAGMQCAGIVAADGGSRITVWPHGEAAPAEHAHGEGLTLSLDPACASCRAQDACPFFASLARRLGFPCAVGVPAGEHVDRLGPRVAYFTDAPGLAGDGWPSGGYYPATGIAGVQGGSADAAVYRATCTLPMSQSATCEATLLNVVRRYG